MRQFAIFVFLILTGSAKSQISYNISAVNLTQESFADTDPDVYFFGSGGLKNSISGDNSNAASATGAIGVVIKQKRWDFLMGYSLNVFKTIEINDVENFGTNIMVPDLTGHSFTASLKGFFYKEVVGLQAEIFIADSKWKIDGTDYDTSPLIFNFRGLLAPFKTIEKGDNRIMPLFHLGYGRRAILGDLSSKDQIREANFGTQKKSFGSLDLSARLIINQTDTFISVLYTKTDDIDHIDGLSGWQVVIGANIIGDLIKL